jgi:hypothetical protein
MIADILGEDAASTLVQGFAASAIMVAMMA